MCRLIVVVLLNGINWCMESFRRNALFFTELFLYPKLFA